MRGRTSGAKPGPGVADLDRDLRAGASRTPIAPRCARPRRRSPARRSGGCCGTPAAAARLSPATFGSSSARCRSMTMPARRHDGGAQRERAAQRGVHADRPPDHLPRSREQQQVADDARGAVGLARRPAAAAPCARGDSRSVRRTSSTCPSTACSGLFSSCAMPATSWLSASDCASCSRRRGPVRLEPALLGHVARDQQRPGQRALGPDERRERHLERAAEPRVVELGRVAVPRRAAARRDRAATSPSALADQVGDRRTTPAPGATGRDAAPPPRSPASPGRRGRG